MTNPVAPPHESRARMVIAISGSSGLLGSALCRALGSHGHEIRTIVRRAPRTPLEISWDPERGTIDEARLEGVDAAIHLAGENIAQRWSPDAKRRIRESRVRGTSVLSRALASIPTRPRTFLSGSAVGIYGDRADETLDESSPLGKTGGNGAEFLPEVCMEWESATAPAAAAGIRVVNLRTGLVLSRHGGALAKLLPLFRIGGGGKLGNGHQWMSWIALSEFVEAIAFLLRNERSAGPYNLVAPNPVSNEEFTRVLAHVIGRPAFLTVPRLALKLTMGEMAVETILASQRVRPRKLLEAGFTFTFPTLESALRDELA